MRGEFIRGDGLVLPNNVTDNGVVLILAAFIGADIDWTPTMILGNGIYTPDMTIAEFEMPAAGSGFTPQTIERLRDTWLIADVNGEYFAETPPVVFSATGPYDRTVTRCALADGERNWLLALSSPLPVPLQIDAATPEADRTFKYRLYLR